MGEVKETIEVKKEKKSLVDEFKEFISRGNVIELAVGLTVGTAFTALVNSLVKDIVMPPIGMLINNENFSELYLNLEGTQYANLAAAEAAGAPVVKYGQFLSNLLNFLIIAVVIFAIVKAVNRLKSGVAPRILRVAKEKK